MSQPFKPSLQTLVTTLLLPQLLLSGCELVGSWEALPCEEDERVQDGACVPCITGAFNEAGDDPQGANTSCAAKTCNEDEFIQDHLCQPCAPGLTRQAGDLTLEEDTSCEPLLCQKDERVENNACVPCAQGLVNAAGDDASGPDTSCESLLCEQDHYVSGNTCLPYPLGTTNPSGDDASGANTTCQPILCAEDQFVKDHVCNDCPTGVMNAAGDDASGADTMCDGALCEENTFVVSNMCLPCPSGTTNAAGDDPAGPNTSCDAELCQEDEWVQNNQCVPCPAGSTNEPGDPTGGTNTSCDPILCEVNEHVQDHVCVPCPSATGNAAGDSARGPDTLCDGSTCPVDTFVLDGACVPCAAGTTNAAGDDPTQQDTSCDPILCEEDQFVSNNMCSACEPGTTNAAGDDASGADTMCDDGTCPFTRANMCVDPIATYIKASNAQGGDQFGFSLAMDGDTLVVASPREGSSATGVNGSQQDNLAARSGAVYVFTRDMSGQWSQQAYLKASNTEAEDNFGYSVAISGDTIVVGAPGESSNGTQMNNMVSDCGAAYVFQRDPVTGVWSQQDYLKHSNVDVGDRFGESVAIDGDRIVVGAPFEDSASSSINGNQNQDTKDDSGAAYIFARQGSSWSQQAYLKASNSEDLDHFGSQVAISGDLVAVSAPNEDSASPGVNGNQMDNSATNSGSVYIYRSDVGTWTQEAYLKASNANQIDDFGSALALHGDTLVVGAAKEASNATGVNGIETNNTAPDAGAAYVFTRDATQAWSQQAYLKASNTDSEDRFGISVAIHGDHILVGAHAEESASTGFLAATPQNNTANNAGAAYLFERDPQRQTWSFLAYIKATNTDAEDRFGSAVAMSSDAIVVGARVEASDAMGINGPQDNNDASSSGAVYVTDFVSIP